MSPLCCLVNRCANDDLRLLQISSDAVWLPSDLRLSLNALYLLSPLLCFFIVLSHDLFVNRDGSLASQKFVMRTEQQTKCFEPLRKLRSRLRRKTGLGPK